MCQSAVLDALFVAALITGKRTSAARQRGDCNGELGTGNWWNDLRRRAVYLWWFYNSWRGGNDGDSSLFGGREALNSVIFCLLFLLCGNETHLFFA